MVFQGLFIQGGLGPFFSITLLCDVFMQDVSLPQVSPPCSGSPGSSSLRHSSPALCRTLPGRQLSPLTSSPLTSRWERREREGKRTLVCPSCRELWQCKGGSPSILFLCSTFNDHCPCFLVVCQQKMGSEVMVCQYFPLKLVVIFQTG